MSASLASATLAIAIALAGLVLYALAWWRAVEPGVWPPATTNLAVTFLAVAAAIGALSLLADGRALLALSVIALCAGLVTMAALSESLPALIICLFVLLSAEGTGALVLARLENSLRRAAPSRVCREGFSSPDRSAEAAAVSRRPFLPKAVRVTGPSGQSQRLL